MISNCQISPISVGSIVDHQEVALCDCYLKAFVIIGQTMPTETFSLFEGLLEDAANVQIMCAKLPLTPLLFVFKVLSFCECIRSQRQDNTDSLEPLDILNH